MLGAWRRAQNEEDVLDDVGITLGTKIGNSQCFIAICMLMRGNSQISKSMGIYRD